MLGTTGPELDFWWRCPLRHRPFRDRGTKTASPLRQWEATQGKPLDQTEINTGYVRQTQMTTPFSSLRPACWDPGLPSVLLRRRHHLFPSQYQAILVHVTVYPPFIPKIPCLAPDNTYRYSALRTNGGCFHVRQLGADPIWLIRRAMVGSSQPHTALIGIQCPDGSG